MDIQEKRSSLHLAADSQRRMRDATENAVTDFVREFEEQTHLRATSFTILRDVEGRITQVQIEARI